MRREAGLEPKRGEQVFRFGNLMQGWPVGLLMLLAVAYAAAARHIDSYVSTMLPLALGCYILSLMWMGSHRLQNSLLYGGSRVPMTVKMFFGFVTVSGVASVFVGLVWYSFGVAFVDGYHWVVNMQPTQNKQHSIVVVCLVVLIIGACFFWARLRLRFVYGATEAGLGISFAAHRYGAETSISLPSETGFYFAVMTAGVYLVVRGMDNMHQAWIEQKDPLARIIYRYGSEPAQYPPKPLMKFRLRGASGARKKKLTRIAMLSGKDSS